MGCALARTTFACATTFVAPAILHWQAWILRECRIPDGALAQVELRPAGGLYDPHEAAIGAQAGVAVFVFSILADPVVVH
jgi:hypothetical protein